MSLDELRALEQAATPGEWWASHVAASGGCTIRTRPENRPVARLTVEDRDGLPDSASPDADAALVVAARNALPGLLGRVAAAEAERDAYQQRLYRAVALALMVWADSDAADAIPDEVWQALHDEKLLATSRDICDEYQTDTTREGRAALVAILAASASGVAEEDT